MTSELAVFIYLPDETSAVPAGLLEIEENGPEVISSSFVYGTRYLERPARLEIDPGALGFARGQAVKGVRLFPTGGLTLFGGIRDAAPDAWGRRVIENRLGVPANSLPESQYLLRAGSNRAGALDIRESPDDSSDPGLIGSVQRLDDVLEAARAIEAGEPVPPHLHEIFDAGPSFGGMRPKASVIDEAQNEWIAKLPSRDDRSFSVPAIEYGALKLAAECGLNVPDVKLVALGPDRPVLLVRRFDRVKTASGTARRHYISALTLLNVHESQSPAMSYPDIAAHQSTFGASGSVKEQQAELFGRMVFNIFVSNDDDHLRNHGFLWTVDGWVLSPLFDVVPRPSHATEKFLHLGIGDAGRTATLTNAMSKHAVFGLDRPAALRTIGRIWSVVQQWRAFFATWSIPAQQIDLIAPAFRHAEDIGGKDIGLTPAGP